ncbi:hypothetical protein Lepto7376_4222 [[Leptolyngbya] sp. PCC 7376]|uniref:hypothetical protein n=1 Tax=[Leptolyngbya] sp. PCC 7376 TaxID=111781 RepID=UPI00029F1321|nr:hypothetical protein [[Leptolyngbya] sp. PCC 7376]AFY40339.1 hypothetical protein Lepto7376_4222 [[Leptolyngbya] sp. PCC 7376]
MNESRVSSVNPPTASSWSAEEDADRLMDDVFSDIDDLLSGKKTSAKIQAAPQSDYTSLQSLVVPQIDLEGTPFTEESDENKEFVIKRGWGYYSERLLFMGSCASLIGVALWMAVNDRLRVPQFLIQPTPVVEVATETTAATATEPIFADYVRRALDNIDRQRSPQAIPVNPAQPSQGAVPSTTDQQPSAQSPQVIERIYVPVYPPEISANARQPLPNATAPITPAPQVIAPQIQAPAPTAPEAVPPVTPDIQAVVPTLPAPPAAAKEVYTLVGVLESGDRSAALFNINGVTQRFRVGENIGASNWKLLSVQNQQILMGQGGQSRSLYVGQNFGLDRE